MSVLEGPHKPQKWTRDDLLNIKADYKERAKVFKANRP